MLLPIPIYIYILSARECNSQQKSDNLRGKRRRVIRNETRTVSLQSIKYIYIYIIFIIILYYNNILILELHIL